MNVALPDFISMTVHREGDQAELVLVERYDDPSIPKLTVHIMKENGWDCSLKNDNTLELHVKGAVGIIGNMMASESLMWSTLGDMTFREVLARLGAVARAP